MKILFTSVLELVPIEIRRDRKNYIVEDILAGEFFEMPLIGVKAIDLIKSKLELESVERLLIEQFPNEEIDLLAFAEQLLQLNLVKSIDGVLVLQKMEEKNKEKIESISPWFGKIFFNKFTNVLYITLFLINIILAITNPRLIPHYKDFFVFDYMSWNLIAIFILSLLVVLFHESGHVLAMRSFGLRTKLEIGHRLFFIVLETDMSAVWKLTLRERHIMYLAGVAFDTVLLFFAFFSQLYFHNLSHLIIGLIRVIALNTIIRLIYQLCIYMKTDLYYVFENVTGCYNLMENAGGFIRKKIPFMKSSNKEIIFEEEKNVIYAYAVFYVIGIILSLSLYIFFYIPQLIYALRKALPGLFDSVSSYTFWDAALFVLQLAFSFGLLFFSWYKKYVRTRFV